MTEFIKKICAYSATTLTSLLAIKTAFSITCAWRWWVLFGASIIGLCALVAWAEIYHGSKEARRKRKPNSGDESVFLTIKRALQTVRFAPPGDESIAHQANNIVRHNLDKHCIKYKDYKQWRLKNPSIFTAIVDDRQELVGFFDVFPLTNEAARSLIDGTMDERGLTMEAILPESENISAKSIYIASICLNPKQTAFSRIVAKEVLVLKLGEFLANTFPPDGKRFLFAYAHTESGERLLRNADFRNKALSHENKQNDPLYELPPDDYVSLALNFRLLPKSQNRRRKQAGVLKANV
jgi:hypothetical protein